jgi:hypothetical protein
VISPVTISLFTSQRDFLPPTRLCSLARDAAALTVAQLIGLVPEELYDLFASPPSNRVLWIGNKEVMFLWLRISSPASWKSPKELRKFPRNSSPASCEPPKELRTFPCGLRGDYFYFYFFFGGGVMGLRTGWEIL